MRSVSLNSSFEFVKEPSRLRNMIGGVKKGAYQSLFIVGEGGTCKSTIVESVLGRDDPNSMAQTTEDSRRKCYWKTGRISPIQFFIFLYKYRDATIVLDDPSNIATSLELVSLLRQLTETRSKRYISWDTQNSRLEEAGCPTTFETRSRFVLIANEWFHDRPEVRALETRAPVIMYQPDPIFMLREAKTHRDEMNPKKPKYESEVVKYIEKAIGQGRVHRLNIRDFVNATARYRNNDPWKEYLEQRFLPNDIEEVDGDGAYIMAWAKRNGKTQFSLRDIAQNTTRFDNRRSTLEEALMDLVRLKKIVTIPVPEKRVGRPPTPRFALNDSGLKIVGKKAVGH